MSAALHRPPTWYFALALVAVPALWLPALVGLAAILAAGPGGAVLAGATTAALGVSTVAQVGAFSGFDRRWVLATTATAVPVGALWAVAEVLVFVAAACGGGPCFG